MAGCVRWMVILLPLPLSPTMDEAMSPSIHCGGEGRGEGDKLLGYDALATFAPLIWPVGPILFGSGFAWWVAG